MRKVRDPSLPYGRRVKALARCVQRYRPLGYLVTFAYLEHVAGSFHRDEAALLRAMDALSSSRDLWLGELGEYARRRKEEKRRGRRVPRAEELRPTSPRYWYGDQRNASVFALGYMLRGVAEGRVVTTGAAGAADPDVLVLASACMERGGRLSRAEHERLRDLQLQSEHLRKASSWWPDAGLIRETVYDSIWVLELIESACSSATTAPTESRTAKVVSRMSDIMGASSRF
jgi:hypothetical protein